MATTHSQHSETPDQNLINWCVIVIVAGVIIIVTGVNSKFIRTKTICKKLKLVA